MDAGFGLLSAVLCVPILGAGLTAFFAGYFKARVCVTGFGVAAAALLGFMLWISYGFYALRAAGDDFCDNVLI